MNILIVKTSSLGDVIHMLPAISDAVQAQPDLKIDWLVEESFSAIPGWHPAVQRVIPIAMRRWKKQWRQRKTWQEIAHVRRQLRQQRYDLIIDSQGLLKSALWAKQALGPCAGYDSQSIREPLASWFYDRKLSVLRQLHAIERNRRLMAQALNYPAPESKPDYGLYGLAKRLPSPALDLPEHSVIGLHATSREDKLWPTDQWISLAQELAKTGCKLILPWGSANERLRAEAIARQGGNAIVLPKLDLNALACLIDQSQAVIGVDTGLLHLAAALGKPGLALYTATPPALTGAVSDRHAHLPLRNLSTTEELSSAFVTNMIITLLKS